MGKYSHLEAFFKPIGALYIDVVKDINKTLLKYSILLNSKGRITTSYAPRPFEGSVDV